MNKVKAQAGEELVRKAAHTPCECSDSLTGLATRVTRQHLDAWPPRYTGTDADTAALSRSSHYHGVTIGQVEIGRRPCFCSETPSRKKEPQGTSLACLTAAACAHSHFTWSLTQQSKLRRPFPCRQVVLPKYWRFKPGVRWSAVNAVVTGRVGNRAFVARGCEASGLPSLLRALSCQRSSILHCRTGLSETAT